MGLVLVISDSNPSPQPGPFPPHPRWIMGAQGLLNRTRRVSTQL